MDPIGIDYSASSRIGVRLAGGHRVIQVPRKRVLEGAWEGKMVCSARTIFKS